MSFNFDNFKSKFKLPELVILETDYWVWSVRPVQATLGAGILSLKRAAESFSDITEDEGRDLAKIIKMIENTLNKSFGYQRINYLMLMMVDYHVHFHVIPRYESEKEFAGIKWSDKGWPKPPVLDAELVEEKVLYEIRDFLQANLK